MKKIFLLLPILGTLLVSCHDAGNTKKDVQPVSGIFSHPSIASISKQIAADPGNAELLFNRAGALHLLEEDSLALNDLNKAVLLDSAKAKYFSAIGELMFDHKDIAGSTMWFQKAIAIDPQDPVSHLKYAKMLVFINDNQKVFDEVNIVLRKDPHNPEAYFLKGMAYKNLKDTAKSISSFQTSVQVDPKYYPSIMQLGLLYSATGDAISLNYFDNAFRLDTTDVMPLYAKGMFYQDRGNFVKAKEMYKQCILYNAQFGDAFFNTGWILMHEDSLEKATRQFDMVTKIEPNNPEAYYNRGLCYELLKDKARAASDYKQAIEFDDTYQEPKDGLKRLGQAK